jgi:hypothetical protein
MTTTVYYELREYDPPDVERAAGATSGEHHALVTWLDTNATPRRIRSAVTLTQLVASTFHDPPRWSVLTAIEDGKPRPFTHDENAELVCPAPPALRALIEQALHPDELPPAGSPAWQ